MKRINIEIDKLRDLLAQAYEEGWCGSKDLALNVAEDILGEFIKTCDLEEGLYEEKCEMRPTRYYTGTASNSNYVNASNQTVEVYYGATEPSQDYPVEEDGGQAQVEMDVESSDVAVESVQQQDQQVNHGQQITFSYSYENVIPESQV